MTMIADTFFYAFDGLARRKLRSFLTIIGIVIGVMAVVLLVTLGQGVDKFIKDQLSFFGDDIMQVIPGSAGGGGFSFLTMTGSLTEKDWMAIQKIPGIAVASPALGEQLSVDYKDETAQLMVAGLKSDYLKVFSAFEIGQGRVNKEGERGVAVVGYKFANDFWGSAKKREKVRLGDRIVVQNKSFTVIGILKSAGGGILAAADSGVYLTFEDGRDVFPTALGNTEIQEIDIKLAPGADPKTVESDIKRVLDNEHRIKTPEDRDFTVITSEQIQSTVGAITGGLTIFLLGIALISFAVGTIGVANTMFMSVLERTREIGILKAVGASDGTIRNIFLVESGLIGALGGAIGVLISFTLVEIVKIVAGYLGTNLQVGVTLQVGVLAITGAFLIGMAAGYFPSKSAASKQAIESLRYE
jgi:putative ABC transport system permease protein